MSSADYWVLGGTISAFLLIMLVHELRAIRREDRNISHLETLIKEVRDARAAWLSARLEASELIRRVNVVEHRVDLLEKA